jgi:glutathione S-transferase
MKLHSSPTSPFARKVNVAAIELGLLDRLELHTVQTSPVGPDLGLVADSPLGKIPCLVLDEGQPLYDSRVICEYLDSLEGRHRLFPATGPARWTALRRQALADGMMDAAVLARYETALRPPDRRWPAWVDGQLDKVNRALDRLEAEGLGPTVDIGTIAIGCALGYLDFRYAEMNWRGTRPALAAWFEALAARPSMQRTPPTG